MQIVTRIHRISYTFHTFIIYVFLAVTFATSVFTSPALGSSEHVSIQLAWRHQFQFAGYYAALHKGFYKQQGLDVTIVEGGTGRFAREEVIRGNSEYGIAGSELVLHRFDGDPLVVLAPIFQHSPSILLAKKSSGVATLQDLINRRIMLLPGKKDADILAAFLNEGISLDSVHRLDQTYNLEDLYQDKTDAVSAYVTNEPWLLSEQGYQPVIISPQTYGVDFYSDCLFTSETEVKKHPKRVNAFLKASIQGWEYAMAHPEEIVDLIISEYGSPTSRAHLLYEAEAIRKIMLPELVEIGHQNPGRWQHIAATYANLQMIDADFSLEGFLYDPNPDFNYRKFKNGIIILAILIIIACGVAIQLFVFNRRLSKEIDDRKVFARALRESEQRLLIAGKAAYDISYEVEIATNTLIWFGDLDDLLGYPKGHIAHDIDTWLSLIHPEDKALLEQAVESQHVSKTPVEYKYRVMHHDGSYRHWLDKRVMIADDTGVTYKLVGVCVDNTEKEKNTRLLRDALLFKEQFFSESPVGMAVYEADSGRCITANKAIADLINAHLEQVLAENYKTIASWRESGILATAQAALDQDTKKHHATHVKSSYGKELYIDCHFAPFTFDGVTHLLVTATDITRRREAEKNIKRQKEKAERYLNLAGVIFIGLDLNGRVNIANQKACEILECSKDDIIGKPWCENFLPKDGRADVSAKFKEMIKGNIENFEYYENDIISETGTRKFIGWHNSVVTSEEGEISGVLSSGEDLTEKRELQARLQHAQKMESIGKLAGGIAHEFNNILSIILGNSEIIQSESHNKAVVEESIADIEYAGLRGRDVVKQLLAFSRQDKLNREIIEITTVVDDALKLLRSSTPAYITINHNFAEDIYPILANNTQINQLLLNICNNAIDAISGTEGSIDIELTNIHVNSDNLHTFQSLTIGKYVQLTIADNGSGMSPDIVNNIFEPYYTTKVFGEGTGIGLAVVHGIVKKHRGVIEVDSTPGLGTKFTIYFPAYEGLLNVQKNTEDIALPGGNESILLVDDEPSILKIGQRHLQSLGYTVHTETDPKEALLHVQSYPEKFDLVISDMSMPSMRGDQLIREILTLCPGLPSIICTGYNSKVPNEIEAKRMGIQAFAMKPLNKAELAILVRKVLDK